jgi:hypothetical protein
MNLQIEGNMLLQINKEEETFFLCFVDKKDKQIMLKKMHGHKINTQTPRV